MFSLILYLLISKTRSPHLTGGRENPYLGIKYSVVGKENGGEGGRHLLWLQLWPLIWPWFAAAACPDASAPPACTLMSLDPPLHFPLLPSPPFLPHPLLATSMPPQLCLHCSLECETGLHPIPITGKGRGQVQPGRGGLRLGAWDCQVPYPYCLIPTICISILGKL